MVLKRLHGDGHWIPWTEGQWLWTQPGRTSAIECEVIYHQGGYQFRVVGERTWHSVMTSARGEWEWITPGEGDHRRMPAK